MDAAVALDAEANGYFSGLVDAPVGSRYQFRLDSGDRPYPDPASRFQPDGPHGSSEVIDPPSFAWTDQSWPGIAIEGQVIYELHVGTFTREGTWAAAERELTELAAIGITMIEMMPVARVRRPVRLGLRRRRPVRADASVRTPGRFPAVRRPRACGPASASSSTSSTTTSARSATTCAPFAPAYFTERYDNEWGDAINFDGADAAPVREFFVANAGYWIDEFHLDGLRLDATQQIFDSSADHIMPGHRRAGARRGARPRRRSSSPKTSRRTRGWSARSPKGAAGSTRCGTTTSTTARWSR